MDWTTSISHDIQAPFGYHGFYRGLTLYVREYLHNVSICRHCLIKHSEHSLNNEKRIKISRSTFQDYLSTSFHLKMTNILHTLSLFSSFFFFVGKFSSNNDHYRNHCLFIVHFNNSTIYYTHTYRLPQENGCKMLFFKSITNKK